MIIAGNHDTLMDARGAYYALVEAQNLRVKKGDNDDDDDDDSHEKPSKLMLGIDLGDIDGNRIVSFRSTCV